VPAKTSARPNGRRALLGMLISAAALALVLAWVDVAALREALHRASGAALARAAGWFLLAMLARAWAWRALLGPNVPLRDAFWALQIGFLANNLLPFRLGEALRVWVVHRTAGVSWGRGMASVALSRMTDALLLLVLALSLWPTQAGSPSLIRGLVGVTLGLMGIVLALVLAPRWGARWLRRWPRVWAEVQAAAALVTPRGLTIFVLGKILTWALLALYYQALLADFAPGLAWPDVLWAMSVSTLGIAIPSAPGYVGVYEAAAVAALTALGVPRATALAFALVQHALYLALTVALGILALARLGWSWEHWRAAWRAVQTPHPTSSSGGGQS